MLSQKFETWFEQQYPYEHITHKLEKTEIRE